MPLTLHHARASVASAKVRLVLSEKALPWVGEVIDLGRGEQHRPEYRAMNPRSIVPTLVHDGRVVVESSVIMHYLDEAFPAVPLMPTDAYHRAAARLWMKKVDERLHPACVTLTFALAFRRSFASKTETELEAHFRSVPDPELREREMLAVKHGLDAPHVPVAAASFEGIFSEMEDALSRTAFLAGDTYSLADAAVTPYVLRAQMLGLEDLWVDCRPNLLRWFEQMRGRPSFQEALAGPIADADRQRLTVASAEVWQRLRNITRVGA